MDNEPETPQEPESGTPNGLSDSAFTLIATIFSLPLWSLLWKSDFIFADSGPRTAWGWFIFIALILYISGTSYWINARRRKREAK